MYNELLKKIRKSMFYGLLLGQLGVDGFVFG